MVTITCNKNFHVKIYHIVFLHFLKIFNYSSISCFKGRIIIHRALGVTQNTKHVVRSLPLDS